MTREQVIKGLEKFKADFKPYAGNSADWKKVDDALAMLKVHEQRVMTLSEIKDYLADPDGDKKPLWLEWSTIPSLSGWVLASQVSDLMKRYMDSYNTTWRPWTSRPTDEQRKAVKWE